MIKPLHPVEIFLHPGDHCFATRDTRISTVVGSCIAMTFWHPQLLMGGMCHYMLPERSSVRKTGNWPAPDGRYADAAIALLLEEIGFVGVSHKEYQVKLFGGGNMFPETNQNKAMVARIGARNIQAARRLVAEHGFTCVAEHLGNIGYRNVIFEVWSGEVWVKHSDVLPISEYDLINGSLG